MIARTLAATTLGAVVLATTTFGAHALWSVQPTASVTAATPVIATPTQFACADTGATWTLSWSTSAGAAATSYEVTSGGNVIATTTATTVVLGSDYWKDTVRVAAVYGTGTGAWKSGTTTTGFQLQNNRCKTVN